MIRHCQEREKHAYSEILFSGILPQKEEGWTSPILQVITRQTIPRRTNTTVFLLNNVSVVSYAHVWYAFSRPYISYVSN